MCFKSLVDLKNQVFKNVIIIKQKKEHKAKSSSSPKKRGRRPRNSWDDNTREFLEKLRKFM